VVTRAAMRSRKKQHSSMSRSVFCLGAVPNSRACGPEAADLNANSAMGAAGQGVENRGGTVRACESAPTGIRIRGEKELVLIVSSLLDEGSYWIQAGAAGPMECHQAPVSAHRPDQVAA